MWPPRRHRRIECWSLIGAICCALGVSLGGSVDAASLDGAQAAEVLILESGDELAGRSLGVVDGQLHWRLRNGEELFVPLSWVTRVDLDPAEPVPPTPIVAPPAPPAAPSAESPPSPINSPAAALAEPEAGWIDRVPLYSQVQQGWLAASDGYAAFNEFARSWTRRINLGGQFIDGNAQTDLFNTQIEFEKSTPRQMRQIDITGNWGRSRGRQTANKWIANANFDWPLEEGDRWIMFFTSKNEYDAPANLDYRGTVSTGMGYRFHNEATKRLITRFGPAYTIEFFRDPYDHRESPDLFGEVELRWPVLKRAAFEQKTRVQPSVLDMELVRVFSTTGFLVDLDDKDRWKLRLGLNYTYNSQPNPGRVPSDFVSTVSLMYTRK